MSVKPLKTRTGRVVELPTDQEDARIDAGIAADPDNPELDDEFFAQAKPAAAVFDATTMAGLVALKRKPGQRGPQKAPTKDRVTLRLSREVIDAFKAGGAGWQTRIDDALRRLVAKRG